MKARFFCAIMAGAAAAGAASAQYQTDFEALNASPEGVILTDQDGYYIPVAGSVDFLAYTYDGNVLGFPQNPEGGDIFIAGEGEASPAFARAQRDITWPTGTVKVTFDLAAAYTDPAGVDPTNNIGSFSLQDHATPLTHNTSIFLASWEDIPARTWQFGYFLYDAAGVQMPPTASGVIPGPEWGGLELLTWYRHSVTMDFATNAILEASITDLATGEMATAEFTDAYLAGGEGGGGLEHPTGFRFFGGGGTAGNVTAWDNLVIEEIDGECYADCDGSGDLDFFDFVCFVNEFEAGAAYADCDESGGLDFFDFVCFVNEFEAGCP